MLPEYRNHGLGRWLKAAMLAKVARERPLVRWVRTDNATTNAPMLKINEELGFRPYRGESVWQVDLEQVRAYLAQAPACDSYPRSLHLKNRKLRFSKGRWFNTGYRLCSSMR